MPLNCWEWAASSLQTPCGISICCQSSTCSYVLIFPLSAALVPLGFPLYFDFLTTQVDKNVSFVHLLNTLMERNRLCSSLLCAGISTAPCGQDGGLTEGNPGRVYNSLFFIFPGRHYGKFKVKEKTKQAVPAPPSTGTACNWDESINMNMHLFVFAKFAQTALIGKQESCVPKALFHDRFQHLLQKHGITKALPI